MVNAMSDVEAAFEPSEVQDLDVHCVSCGWSVDLADEGDNRELTKTLLPGHICNVCIAALTDQSFVSPVCSTNSAGEPKSPYDFAPDEISQKIKEIVIGQDDAVDKLSLIIHRHVQSLKNPKISARYKRTPLIIGPSGSGKTLFVDTLSKLLKLPYVTIDASTLTASGFLGQSVSEEFVKYAKSSKLKGNVVRNLIVFVDEIDKKSGGGGNGNEIHKSDVLNEFLKYVESGCSSLDDTYSLDGDSVLFIFAGAFEFIRQTKNVRKAGFTKAVDSQNVSELTDTDIAKAGFLPELLNRLEIVEFKKLGQEENRKMLLSEAGALKAKQVELRELYNIELEVPELDVIDAIAEKIQKNGADGRALGRIINNFGDAIIMGSVKKYGSESKQVVARIPLEAVSDPSKIQLHESTES